MHSRPFLSILMPAHNEEESLPRTCDAIMETFARADIRDYEILVVNDHSEDRTREVLADLAARAPQIRYVDNVGARGFGCAIRMGLREYRGDAVAIVMADLSDSPEDLLRYDRALREGAECVFGSRFIHGSALHDYPPHKLILNRLANYFIKALFRLDHNDITNAFKAYRREVIEGIQPLLSSHFNLAVELPLKAIVRGYTYVKIPISWTNRQSGVSKLRIKEMSGRYLFIILYCWLEKTLARDDYYRRPDTLFLRDADQPANVGREDRT